MSRGFIIIRVPSRTPAFRDDLLIIHKDLGITGVMQFEMVRTGLLCLDLALPSSGSARLREVCRQVLDGFQILIIHLILIPSD